MSPCVHSVLAASVARISLQYLQIFVFRMYTSTSSLASGRRKTVKSIYINILLRDRLCDSWSCKLTDPSLEISELFLYHRLQNGFGLCLSHAMRTANPSSGGYGLWSVKQRTRCHLLVSFIRDLRLSRWWRFKSRSYVLWRRVV